MRVSSDRQAKEGDSIPAQRDALMEYIQSHPDLYFAGEYVDEGISGTKYDRQALQRLIDEVKQGNVDLIIVTKMDRLHRSLRNFLNMQEILDKHKCDWLAIWEQQYDTTTPQGRMVINMMVNLAQFEAEQTGQRVRQVFEYKVTQGESLSRNQPLGFSVVDKHLVQNEDAPRVKAIFDHFNATSSVSDTTRFAASIGVCRSPQNVRRILSQTKYKGEFRGNPEYCPRIVSPEAFDLAQRQLKSNIKPTQKREYIFKGLMVCAKCGGKMGGHRTHSNGHDYILYRCIRHAKPVPMCDNGKTINEDLMERIAIERLEGMSKRLKLTVEDNTRRNTAEQQRAALKRRLERLKASYLDGVIPLNEYKADRERMERELADIKEPQPVPKEQIEALSGIASDIYATFSRAEKRIFWRMVIKKITFTDNKHLDIEFLP